MLAKSFPFRGSIEPELFGLLWTILVELQGGIDFSTFSISFRLPKPCSFEKEAKLLQTKLIKQFQGEFDSVLDFNFPDVSFLVNFEHNNIECTVLPVFVVGTYNKYSRNLPQTIHYCFECKGSGCMSCQFSGKSSKESIQELLEDYFLPAFEASESKFHGAGREDKNVRMLGSGRLFVIEILSAKKRNVNLLELENKINSVLFEKIQVHDLGFCRQDTVARIKTEIHEKIYSAKIACESPFDSKKLQNLLGQKFQLIQLTPTRSQKSRSNLERKHSVVLQNFSILSEKQFQLDMLCSHGMYVKEFISGDENRTSPSLSELLDIPCQCVELDVLQIV